MTAFSDDKEHAMTTVQQLAEAFSSHRFQEVYDHLAEDVRWVVPGQTTTEGRNAVVATCDGSLAELAGTTTTFTRFVSVADARTGAVDVVAQYVGADGSTFVVSSADIYELDDDGRLATITSYAVELDAAGAAG